MKTGPMGEPAVKLGMIVMSCGHSRRDPGGATPRVRRTMEGFCWEQGCLDYRPIVRRESVPIEDTAPLG